MSQWRFSFFSSTILNGLVLIEWPIFWVILRVYVRPAYEQAMGYNLWVIGHCQWLGMMYIKSNMQMQERSLLPKWHFWHLVHVIQFLSLHLGKSLTDYKYFFQCIPIKFLWSFHYCQPKLDYQLQNHVDPHTLPTNFQFVNEKAFGVTRVWLLLIVNLEWSPHCW